MPATAEQQQASVNHSMDKRREEKAAEKADQMIEMGTAGISTLTVAQLELMQKQIGYVSTLAAYWTDTLRAIQDGMDRVIGNARQFGDEMGESQRRKQQQR